MAGELWHTDVQIRAVLDTLSLSLRDVLHWKVGTRLPLNAVPDSAKSSFCAAICLMFSGKMGRKSGNMAVRIDEKIDPKPKDR